MRDDAEGAERWEESQKRRRGAREESTPDSLNVVMGLPDTSDSSARCPRGTKRYKQPRAR